MVGEADAGSTGDAAETVGHEGGALLVANADEAHVLAIIEGIEYVEERRADDAENVGDTLLFQELNYGLACLESLGQLRRLRWSRSPRSLTQRVMASPGLCDK